jgi:hypothetical protein
MNFKLSLRNWSVTREFEGFTREFLRSRKFAAFTRSFLLGETSNMSCLYLFFFNIPVPIKETKKKTGFLFTKGIPSF